MAGGGGTAQPVPTVALRHTVPKNISQGREYTNTRTSGWFEGQDPLHPDIHNTYRQITHEETNKEKS